MGQNPKHTKAMRNDRDRQERKRRERQIRLDKLARSINPNFDAGIFVRVVPTGVKSALERPAKVHREQAMVASAPHWAGGNSRSKKNSRSRKRRKR